MLLVLVMMLLLDVGDDDAGVFGGVSVVDSVGGAGIIKKNLCAHISIS